MILQRLNPETVGVKVAKSQIVLKTDGSIKVGDRSTEGPGEYDIEGVGLHVMVGHAVIFTEGVRLAVVWDPVTTFDPEDDAAVDVFVFLLEDGDAVSRIIKDTDPRLVILKSAAVCDKLRGAGVTVQEESSYKLTAQSLPSEDRVIINLV